MIISNSIVPLWWPAMHGMPGGFGSDWRALDLAEVTAWLPINGREIGNGRAGDVMGNLLNVRAWLADKLTAAGTPLRRGMPVTTGSMAPIQYPIAGDRVSVEVFGLGTAELAVK